MPSATADVPEARFRITCRVLVILASLFAFLSIFTTWIDRQALDNDEWVNTSGRLLDDRAISDAVANYTVERLFASVDISDELKKRLPEDVKPLSAPAAGALRQFAIRVAEQALQTPRLQSAWKQANATAHSNLVAILEDKNDAVSTANGRVVLDLRPVVEQLAARIGVDKKLADKIPADVAQVEIVRADELKNAQTITKIFKGLAIVFSIGTLFLFALAAYLARGRRWVVVLGYGVGLIVAGVAALALRKVAGGVVVDQLVSDDSVRTAAEHAFSIGTDLLASIAKTVIVVGALFAVAAFLASPADSAVAVRRAMAPSFIGRPALTWSVFAALVLLLLILSPPNSSGELYSALALVALAGFGMEALSRKIHREFPDAKPGDMRERIRERMRELGADGARRAKAAFGDISELAAREPHPEDARLDRLAKLGELRESGILTAAEFKAEKQRLLNGESAETDPATVGTKPAAKRPTRAAPSKPTTKK